MKESLTHIIKMFETNLEKFRKDLIEEIDLFSLNEDVKIRHVFKESNGKVVNTVTVDGKVYAYGNLIGNPKSKLVETRLIKRYAKLSIYKALSAFTGKSLPWGALTGIRPTKMAYTEMANGQDFEEFFRNTMKVSDEKVLLTKRVIESQEGIYRRSDDDTDFFVFIPFCPSRCKYCSFITADLQSARKHVDEYVDTLIYEIEQSAKYIKNLRSIYIGGGTPVSLSYENLEKVLKAVSKINTGVEYTVEAGRPDCITKENLELLMEYGVTRICINPQTFNDETLQRIGRYHSAEQIIEKYQLAKEKFIINMDLIAGLDGETVEDFMRSIEKTISLSPDNVTVHTLSVKHGSNLAKSVKFLEKGEIEQMINYADKRLSEEGYNPYYLYRQKYMAGNLENVGYSKKGKECVYNIDVMEETTSVVACGAGSISKRVFTLEDRIERYASPKDVATYIGKIEEILPKKDLLFK